MLESFVKSIYADYCWSCIIAPVLILSYALYYRKYRNYIYEQYNDIKNSSKPRGKCPPFFPNGWFRLLNSEELKVNEVKAIDYCGRNIVLFRGTNKKVYALHAYCSHMGANLGHGGKVKYSQCIQCPFHGWVFDGESGHSVVSENLAKKNIEEFQYNDLKRQEKKNGTYLYKCYDGNAKLKKYHVKEQHNSIMVWYDSRDDYQDNYPFEPFEFEHSLEYRGESINYVNCHIQEIPENGADMRHFDFLHTRVFDYISFVKFHWTMQSERATEPNLLKLMNHKFETINIFKKRLIDKYINETNAKYINIINLNCHLEIFNFRFFFFNGTGFQVGPGLVYLFLKSFVFEASLAQSVTPLNKFYQKISHKIYTNWYIPYWLSAYMLYGEVRQLFSDMTIWNNKIFGSSLSYNLKTDADKALLGWRNWFSQFYEGCYDREKQIDSLEW